MATTINTIENASSVNSNVKTTADKVSAILALVRREMITNRNVVATLWDNRNDETLKEIADVLFTDCKNTTRKTAIAGGLKRYIKLFPFAIVVKYDEKHIDYKCASLTEVATGIYQPKEIDAIETLEKVLYNHYNGGKSIAVEFGKFYDIDGNIIDAEAAKEAIKSAKDERKEERAQKTEERNAKIVNETNFSELIIAAIKKAPSDEIADMLNAILKM